MYRRDARQVAGEPSLSIMSSVPERVQDIRRDYAEVAPSLVLLFFEHRKNPVSSVRDLVHQISLD